MEEFRKKVDREFWKLFDHMDEEIIRLFQDLQIRNGDIDLAATSLRGPSSTWTYLINDNPFGGFNMAMLAHRFAGAAAAMGVMSLLLSPLILVVIFVKKMVSRLENRSKRKRE